jgi:tetratricopeptide (TPR) repeat protein
MKTLKYILAVLLAIAAAFFIPQAFIHSHLLTGTLDKVLHLKVDPDFNGGDILVRFMDKLYDDYGEGELTYPRHQGFKGKGYLDIVRYTVHEPLSNARWSEDIDFWQLALTFSGVHNAFDSVHDFSHPVIHVYIDIDGTAGGSTETTFPRAELVEFDKNHPWDFMVQIDGHHEWGKLISWDNQIEERVRIYSVPENKTIYARILLNNERINKVLDGRTTYHYVLVGAYNEYTSGNFMHVKKKSGTSNGGGSKSKLTPRVFDYIAPKGYDQKEVLSSYDENKYTYAVVYPLEVKRTDKQHVMDEDLIEKYRKLAEEEKKNKSEADLIELERIKSSGSSGIELAAAYFRSGMFKEAEEILVKILENNPDNSQALAYNGSVAAMKGGETKSLAKAVEYVNKAFEYFDRAESLAQNDDDLIVVLLNRGNVAISVPELVFQKSLQGAEDFLNVFEILVSRESADKELLINCCRNAAQAYERAGKEDEAELFYMKTLGMDDLSYSVMYELIMKGYVKD